MIEKLVSGGQTGVDRAALDVAAEQALPSGGWCPKGRLAEDGALDRRYPVKETPSADYSQRTEWNVRDSDGTLVLHQGRLSDGTSFTVNLASRYGRPHLVLDLTHQPEYAAVVEWIEQHQVRILNVAGPRESGNPGIYLEACLFLSQLFIELQIAY